MRLVICTPWCLIGWFQKKKKGLLIVFFYQLDHYCATDLVIELSPNLSRYKNYIAFFCLAFKTLSDSYACLVCFLFWLNGLWCVFKYGRQRDICTKSALKAARWVLMSESISGQLRWHRVQRQTGEKGKKNPKTTKCCVRPSLPNRWHSVWAFKGFYV